MIKKLDDNLTLYFNNLFPYVNEQVQLKKNTITIGIGGNIGDVIQRFKHLFKMLQIDSRLILTHTSPILKNPPFGYLEQDYFFNAVIILQTNLSPIQALDTFQRYENRFKRTRSFQDAPRTLDIDIIFYNKLKMNTKRLTLPHKGYKKRQSVLIPLSYIHKQKYGKVTKLLE